MKKSTLNYSTQNFGFAKRWKRSRAGGKFMLIFSVVFVQPIQTLTNLKLPIQAYRKSITLIGKPQKGFNFKGKEISLSPLVAISDVCPCVL